MSLNKCYIVVYSTVTVDGRIASKTRYSKLSCPYDLKRLHELRAKSDGVMVGANTVIIDDPSLRVKYVKGKNPMRIVIDGLLKTPLEARVYTLKTAKTLVLTTAMAPKDKIKALRDLGVEVVEFPGKPPIDMKRAIEELYNRGLRKVMVEGGGELLWHLFKDRVVDELRVTLSPYIFGGRNSISLVMGEGFSSTEDARKLKLMSVKICRCKQEVHLRYKIVG